jgi:hypothetical protein
MTEREAECIMAGVTHLGVGLAAKYIAPDVPVGALVAAAYGCDIVWGVCYATGIEQYATSGLPSPWSHGLFMSVLWSVAAALITLLITRKARTSWIIGLLVFSHWLIDFMAKPMLHAFPMDVGVPIFFSGSPVIGLGLWKTALGEYIGEYIPVALGAVIYVVTLIKLRKAHIAAAAQRAS